MAQVARYADRDRQALGALLARCELPAFWLAETDKPHADVLVARSEEQPERLLGFVIAWRVADELEIVQIATDPEWRRRYLARDLLEELLGAARGDGLRAAFLEVRAKNTAARRLYEGQGFSVVGVRAGYYDEGQEDAVLMSIVLAPAPVH